MLRIFLSGAVFLAAFVTGTAAVFGLAGESVEGHNCGRRADVLPTAVEPANGQVEIRYLGSGQSEGGKTLKFRVVNRTRSAVFYSAYSKESPFPQVEFNGQEVPMFHCGTGTVEQNLAAGESITVEISEAYFHQKGKQGKYKAGFYFRSRTGQPKLWQSAEFEL